ncbi:MAG TPA: hypothetical protein VGV59_10955 [Pyrinomonadaceae bacterium]|nr:hypothetical protein [Pyrinomonadaceae bacterium]
MPREPEKSVQNSQVWQFKSTKPVHVVGSGGDYKRFSVVLNKPLPPGHEIRLLYASVGKQYAVVWSTPVDTRAGYISGGKHLTPDEYKIVPVEENDRGGSQRQRQREPASQHQRATHTPQKLPETRAEQVKEVSPSPATPPQPAPVDKEQPTPPTPQPTPEPTPDPIAEPVVVPPSPQSRATQEQPSAPGGREASESTSGGFFGGWSSASELADLLDKKIDQLSHATHVIDKELDEFVTEHDGLPAVLAATAAQTIVDLGREKLEDLKSNVDVLRVGQGVAKGDAAGILEDVGRVVVALPLAGVFRAAGMTAAAAAKKVLKIRRQQLAFVQRVEKIYRAQLEHVMKTHPSMSPQDVGTEADRLTKEILAKKYEGILELFFDEETGTTKGKKTDRMHNIDIVIPRLFLVIELKKSPAAVKRIQKLAQHTYSLIYDYTHVTIFGHP